MHAVVHVVAAVLVRAIGEGSEVVERSFCGLVSVGQPCSGARGVQSFHRPMGRVRHYTHGSGRLAALCLRTRRDTHVHVQVRFRRCR